MHLFLMLKMTKITSKIHERTHLFLIKHVEDVEDKENHIQCMKGCECGFIS